MAKLLLKADGILCDTWCPLDPPPPYEPPERWDGPHVSVRYTEAFQIIGRMPRSRLGPAGFFNTWPAWQRDFDELVAMVGTEALQLEQQQRNRVIILPTSREISAMERALAWPGAYLRAHPDLAQALNLCSLARARDCDLGELVRHHRRERRERRQAISRRSESEWRRLARAAADWIAGELRRDRVTVF